MNEKTTGQQACIAWNAAFGEQFGIIAADEWELGDPRGRAAWEAAAQAARADVIAERDKYRGELENALRVMLLSRDTADTALAIRERTGLLPLKAVKGK